MEILRTPDERFTILPDFSFEPHYCNVHGLRMHYIDEGENDKEIVLMLHGEPSWSFLYRKMIPIFVDAGFRAIAPDLIGFGRSDKPAAAEDYTYQNHVDWVAEFIQRIDLQNITLVCQDWGGLIGLRLAAEHETRFKRIAAANTFLPTGDTQPPEAFFKWREFSQKIPVFEVGRVVNGGCVSDLPPEVIAVYDAPYPDEAYKAGARQFPMLVPVAPDDPAAESNRRAWQALRKWQKPFLTAFSDSDPITRGGDVYFQKAIPGAMHQKHVTIKGAGHFLQEDKGEEFARMIVEFIKTN